MEKFSLSDLQKNYKEKALTVTMMCTGNRRSEFNTEKDGETMGLKWRNGSISTARWTGCSLTEVLRSCGITSDLEDEGYKFVTLTGAEAYHISVPLRKALQKDGDCSLVWKMNGEQLPRDHGYPLRAIIPGYVGARSVKWIEKIVVTKEECDGTHQKGIAYKQLGPNQKKLSSVPKEYIESLPPIDHVPITSAITLPEPGAIVRPGQILNLAGYAYAGAGLAVIRVDVSVDGGETWGQAEMQRADPMQSIRSGRAWAWVQWKFITKVPDNAPSDFKVVCKAIDDQYNQQPHDPSPIWNIRGILNTSWGQVMLKATKEGELEISEEARSGDGSLDNVGVKMDGTFQCSQCRQKFPSEQAQKLHWKFVHDPNRHQED
jgi:sulfite oxidase